MLHRTQAKQVVPVYLKFIDKYPDFNSICNAGVEKIRAELNSLGLKWRSEELYNLSCHIVKRYTGKIPDSKAELLELPGIGPYISSAVMNFAFNKPEPVLDTNTVRVIGRFFGMQINDSSRRNKRFEAIIKDLVNFKDHKKFIWYLLDFANYVCKPRNPDCFVCPLNDYCSYFMEWIINEDQNNRRDDKRSFGTPRRS